MTGETVGAKQLPETSQATDTEPPVPQAAQPETRHLETRIITAPNEDISKWRRYAVTYYGRSVKSATEEARRNNRETYEQYKALLEAAGYSITEEDTTINIKNPQP